MVRGITSAAIVPTASDDNGEELPQASISDDEEGAEHSSEEEGTHHPASTVPELQSGNYLQAAFNGKISAVDLKASDPSFATGGHLPETTPQSSTTDSTSSLQHPSTAKTVQPKPVAALIGKSLRQRSQSALIQKQSGVDLTKNYIELVRDFRQLRPFTRCPDGKYPADTLCVYCANAKPTSVLFPCQHMCVCNACIKSSNISTDYTSATDWCACPVCMADIRLILPHSGKEEEKYWKWVLEIKPSLPAQFKQQFKDAGRRLHKSATPTRSRRSSIVTMFRREPTPQQELTPQQEPPKVPETSKNPPPTQKVPVPGRCHSWHPGEVANVQNVAASNEQEEAHNCSIL